MMYKAYFALLDGIDNRLFIIWSIINEKLSLILEECFIVIAMLLWGCSLTTYYKKSEFILDYYDGL